MSSPVRMSRGSEAARVYSRKVHLARGRDILRHIDGLLSVNDGFYHVIDRFTTLCMISCGETGLECIETMVKLLLGDRQFTMLTSVSHISRLLESTAPTSLKRVLSAGR